MSTETVEKRRLGPSCPAWCLGHSTTTLDDTHWSDEWDLDNVDVWLGRAEVTAGVALYAQQVPGRVGPEIVVSWDPRSMNDPSEALIMTPAAAAEIRDRLTSILEKLGSRGASMSAEAAERQAWTGTEDAGWALLADQCAKVRARQARLRALADELAQQCDMWEQIIRDRELAPA